MKAKTGIRPADMPNFGEPLPDIPVVAKASFYTCYFAVTGWYPRADDLPRLKSFVGDVIAALDQDPDVETQDLEVLLAIGAGVSAELERLRETGIILS
jgi:hypothetical protein